MKLSEAIRQGAKLRPQGFNNSFKEIEGVIHSCAWGAAHEAITGNADVSQGAIMWKTHANIVTTSVINPVTKKPRILSLVITDLNDAHKWSREQIADWLKEIGF
jgi:hypothetical protein